ncbi:MAG: hypothetical protein ACLFPU_06230 [Dehalococcoidia bacterium]
MSTVAAAEIPRGQIFEYGAQLPGESSKYFKDVELIARRLGYDYAQACQMEADVIGDSMVSSMLRRIAGSLSAGEDPSEFLAREAKAVAEEYGNHYERKLDTLKQWTDAYVALVIAGVLVVIIAIVSTMIWQIQTSFILILVGLTIGITVMGAWLISLMSPKETVTSKEPTSKEQKLAKKLFMALVPLAAVAGVMLIMMGATAGYPLIVAGLLVFPVGFVSALDDKKISRRDADVATLLRSLGGVATAIGSTVGEALGRIDLRSVESLMTNSKRLLVRLQSGIKSKLCWDRFVEETGSVVVSRSVGMFRDALDLGAEPEEVGKRASAYATTVSTLRSKRKMISKPFSWLTFVMHAAVAMLLVFIVEVMTKFGSVIQTMEEEIKDPGSVSASAPSMTSYFSFHFAGLELLNTLVLPVLLVLTVVNALAPKIADGGHNYKILQNLGITMVISGLCFVVVPVLTEMIFGVAAMGG